MKKNSGQIFLDSDLELDFPFESLVDAKSYQIHSALPERLLENGLANKTDLIILSGKALRSAFDKWLQFEENVSSDKVQIIYLVEPRDVELVANINQFQTHQYTKTPVSKAELQYLVQNALQRLSLRANDAETIPGMGPLIGKSHCMQNLYRMIKKAATGEFHVLIVGETGTGKDLTAQAIHQHSSRKKRPFVPVNLASLPDELVSTELFGHEKGAFTSANSAREGKFEIASDGTIFLDEISAIDNKLQVSLLRLIEQKKFYRLGSQTPVEANARIIAASNEDLESLVAQDRFREDLFFRLDVFRIMVPPLRDRKDDIPLLVEHFIRKFSQELDKKVTDVSPHVLALLQNHDWPGNVRELKNVVQRGVLMCNGKMVRQSHLPGRFQDQDPENPILQFEMGTSLEEIERRTVLWALDLAQSNRSRAAKLLGISRRALYNKMERFGIH